MESIVFDCNHDQLIRSWFKQGFIMHQLILGATFPLTIALVIYIIRRCRAPMWLLLLTPPLMGFCAMWAVVPDIPRIIGWHSLYKTMASNPLSDIFFWHYSIDQIEAAHLDSMTPFFNACFALLLLALMAAAWRELRFAEKQSLATPEPRNNRTSNIEHSTSNTQHRTLNYQYPACHAGDAKREGGNPAPST